MDIFPRWIGPDGRRFSPAAGQLPPAAAWSNSSDGHRFDPGGKSEGTTRSFRSKFERPHVRRVQKSKPGRLPMRATWCGLEELRCIGQFECVPDVELGRVAQTGYLKRRRISMLHQ